MCLKALKPGEVFHTCNGCQHRVCEDCSSYSKPASDEEAVRLIILKIVYASTLLLSGHCYYKSSSQPMYRSIIRNVLDRHFSLYLRHIWRSPFAVEILLFDECLYSYTVNNHKFNIYLESLEYSRRVLLVGKILFMPVQTLHIISNDILRFLLSI